MSKRAETAAMKAYPKEEGKAFHSAFGTLEFDKNALQREGFIKGYEQAEKDLGWHSVKESLPPIDKEVIVLTDDINGKIVPNAHKICYGHRPNLYDEIKHYDVVTYNGWNIPGVTHWMYLPKITDEE